MHLHITLENVPNIDLTRSCQDNDELARIQSEAEALGSHIRLQTSPGGPRLTIEVAPSAAKTSSNEHTSTNESPSDPSSADIPPDRASSLTTPIRF